MTLSLSEYYQSLGFSTSKWHVGVEHPELEQYAIRLLQALPGARVLEIGYQAGGFAVPVILSMQEREGFDYLGVDSLNYGNAVNGDVIGTYLKSRGINTGFRFLEADSYAFLSQEANAPFDLVLIDHYKPLYPRDLLAVVKAGLVNPQGIILLHDILGRARARASLCEVIARAYGYSWMVTNEVPEGLAVLRNAGMLHQETFSLGKRLWRGIVGIFVRVQQLSCLANSAVRGVRHKLSPTQLNQI